MEWTITLALGAAAIGLTVLSGWMGARAPDPVRGPRLVPWRFLMILGAFGSLMVVVHILNLAGVTTGRTGSG